MLEPFEAKPMSQAVLELTESLRKRLPRLCVGRARDLLNTLGERHRLELEQLLHLACDTDSVYSLLDTLRERWQELLAVEGLPNVELKRHEAIGRFMRMLIKPPAPKSLLVLE